LGDLTAWSHATRRHESRLPAAWNQYQTHNTLLGDRSPVTSELHAELTEWHISGQLALWFSSQSHPGSRL